MTLIFKQQRKESISFNIFEVIPVYGSYFQNDNLILENFSSVHQIVCSVRVSDNKVIFYYYLKEIYLSHSPYFPVVMNLVDWIGLTVVVTTSARQKLIRISFYYYFIIISEVKNTKCIVYRYTKLNTIYKKYPLFKDHTPGRIMNQNYDLRKNITYHGKRFVHFILNYLIAIKHRHHHSYSLLFNFKFIH